MRRAKDRPTIVVDGYTRCCLMAIAVLLTVLVLGLWVTGPVGPASISAAAPLARTAEAAGGGIGNPSAQRLAIINAIQATNQKLDQIVRLLESGRIKVVLVEGEGKDAAVDVRRPKK